MVVAILVDDGVSGTVTVAPDESQRVEKGRLRRAAKERGRILVWRKAPARELRFVLAEPEGLIPGARRRRTVAEQQTERIVCDAVMTEDVAAVTDTTAAAETEQTEEAAEAIDPSAAPRRRARKST
jgi:hypothetical protein